MHGIDKVHEKIANSSNDISALCRPRRQGLLSFLQLKSERLPPQNDRTDPPGMKEFRKFAMLKSVPAQPVQMSDLDGSSKGDDDHAEII